MGETVSEPEGERIVGFVGALEWLEELLTSPWTNDKAARLAGIEILQETLSRIGVDVESLVRYGLGEQISGTLIASLILDTSFPGKMNNFLVVTGRWRELLQIPFRDSTSPLQQLEPVQFNGVVSKARSHILAWIKNAPFAEVASFIPPTEDQLREYVLHTELNDDRVAADYVWIWQRTRVEEMYRWSDESLFKEFRWLEGDSVVTFPVSILADAGPSSASVNHEIARRAAHAADKPVSAADPLVWQMQDQALKLLAQNKPEEAAALFAFYLDLHPDNVIARNNLGFCKMPTSPESALHHLRLAERGGYVSRAINVFNQCCCLTMLSREGEALDRAEYYWQREFQPDHLGGYLWTYSQTGWALTAEQNPNLGIARMALEIAAALGREDRAQVWGHRVSEIVSAWSAGDGLETDNNAA